MEFLHSTKCDEAFNDVEDYQIGIVHIWLRQRSSKKYVTEIQNLAVDLNLNKLMKFMRHEFHCSVAKTENKEKQSILRLQGDQRENIVAFLVVEKIIAKEYIKIHGF